MTVTYPEWRTVCGASFHDSLTEMGRELTVERTRAGLEM